MKFTRMSSDLYVFDASSVDIPTLQTAFSFLNTVEGNKKLFKARDVRKADEANAFNRRINHVAKDKFIRIVQHNWIRNCPLTVGDIRRSHQIYGPPLPPIKGRTRNVTAPRLDDIEIVQIPQALYDDLKYVILCLDFMYVNGIPVMHSISRRVDYRTVGFPTSRSKTSMKVEIESIKRKYHARGFKIVEIHADKEFEKVREDILLQDWSVVEWTHMCQKWKGPSKQ